MRNALDAVKAFINAVYAAFGQKKVKAESFQNNRAEEKTHIKKKYPFSSERQHARYRRQIANSQLNFHQIKV